MDRQIVISPIELKKAIEVIEAREPIEERGLTEAKEAKEAKEANEANAANAANAAREGREATGANEEERPVLREVEKTLRKVRKIKVISFNIVGTCLFPFISLLVPVDRVHFFCHS